MNSVNKVLLLFVLIISIFLIGTWSFIQSEKFGYFLSEKITEFTQKKINTSIEFSNIKLNFVPLGTKFENFKLETVQEGKYSIAAQDVSLNFSLFDLLSNKLTIDNLRVNSGIVVINPELTDQKENDKKIIIEKIFNVIQSHTLENTKLRMKSFSLYDVAVQSEKYGNSYIDNLNLSVYKTALVIQGALNLSGLASLLKTENKKYFSHDQILLDAELTNKRLRVKSLEVKDKLNRMSFSGIVSNDQSGELVTVSEMSYEGGVSKFNDFLNVNLEGYCKIGFSINGRLLNPDALINLQFLEFSSPWAIVDDANISASLKGGVLSIQNANMKRNEGVLQIKKEVPLYDIEKNQLIFKHADLKLENFHTNDALFFLNKTLSILKGEITGDIKFAYEDDLLKFKIAEGANLNNFILGDNKSNYILKNKLLKFFDSQVIVELTGATYLDMDVAFTGSRFHSKGWIKDGRIDLHSNVGRIDLIGLGPVAGTLLKGHGPIKFDVIGPFDDVNLLFDTELEDFEVFQYRFGKVNSEFSININKNNLELKSLIAKKDRADYTARGGINFSNGKIDMVFDIPNMPYQQLADICYPLVKNQWMPAFDKTFLNVTTSFRIFGKATYAGLRIEGHATSKAISLYNESLDSISLNFGYINGDLNLKNIFVTKDNGILKSNIQYNGITEFLKYDLSISNLNLNSLSLYQILNLGFEGKLNANLKGNGFLKNYNSEAKFTLDDSSVDQIPVGDSSLNVNLSGGDIEISGNLLSKQINFESNINLNKNVPRKSNFRIQADIDNVKKIFGALEKKNMSDPYLKGAVAGLLEGSFDFYDYKRGNLVLVLDYLNLERKGTDIRTNGTDNKIIIENGIIKKWNIDLKGENDYLISKGRGSIYSSFKVNTEYKFHANIFELFTSRFTFSDGDVAGRSLLIGENLKLESYIESTGTNIKFNYNELPGLFTNVDFHAIAEGGIVQITSLSGDYGNGKVSASGVVKFGLNYPEIDLSYDVNKAFVRAFDKSGFLINAKGKVLGSHLPYQVTGDINLLHGKIYDEIEELAKNNSSSGLEFKYIPERKKEKKFSIADYNFVISMLGPIHIKNKLSDIKMRGKLNIFGSGLKPVINGKLITINNSDSRFKFKGHEFFINEGEIDFGDKADGKQIFLKFSGVAKVKNYDIKLDLQGASDKLAMSLSSNPALAKEDLFSLLTLGVTSDVSRDLGENQRESVTTIGIGTLIFDQLKLNEGLSSSMGLKLSILPDVAKDDSTLLEGKSAVSSQSSKVRSTTKIKLEKKVTEKIDVSLTSTLGGTIDQKQEMNINYNINDNFSLDGVFEVNDKDEESSKSSQSLGADIKYKWSF